jgi:tripartite-type tricarboxylate transporter receptor subunit TctC
LKEFLGLNLKMIMYPATPEAMLALERKEVDARAGSYSSLKPYIDRGVIRPLIRGRASEAGIDNLPVDEDLVKDSRAKTIMAMRSAGEQIGRPYVAPPGTPENVMKILRDAFAKAAEDPELKEDAKKNMMEVEYTPAAECLKVIDFLLKQPEDIIKEFSKYMKF